jgi:hypothetical protein
MPLDPPPTVAEKPPSAIAALVPVGAGAAVVALLVVSIVVTKAFGDVIIDIMAMAIVGAVCYWKGYWKGRSSR